MTHETGPVVTLVSDRLVLRPFRASDGDGLATFLTDPDVLRFEPYGAFDPAECADEAARRAQNADFRAVCLRAGSSDLIGSLWFHRTEPDAYRTWELGYVFARSAWHQGYATEACRRVLDHAFADLGAHRVVAHCDPRNTPSWRLLARLGMRREAHHRSAATFADDDAGRPVWHDAYVYAVLAEEWKA